MMIPFALDLIDEVGHSGEFLAKDHTFQYCHSEPLNPTIGSRGRVSDNLHQLDINIEKTLQSADGQLTCSPTGRRPWKKSRNPHLSRRGSQPFWIKIETM